MAIGRPKVPASKKKRVAGFSLTPGQIDWIVKTAKVHGVPMSQIVDDGLKMLKGEMEATLGNLRQELADQRSIIDRLSELANNQQVELKRLQASQDLVGAIVSPYGPKNDSMPKMDQEKARTVRAMLKSETARTILKLRAGGDDGHSLLDIHKDGLKAWGSWLAYWKAVESAQAAGGAL